MALFLSTWRTLTAYPLPVSLAVLICSGEYFRFAIAVPFRWNQIIHIPSGTNEGEPATTVSPWATPSSMARSLLMICSGEYFRFAIAVPFRWNQIIHIPSGTNEGEPATRRCRHGSWRWAIFQETIFTIAGSPQMIVERFTNTNYSTTFTLTNARRRIYWCKWIIAAGFDAASVSRHP